MIDVKQLRIGNIVRQISDWEIEEIKGDWVRLSDGSYHRPDVVFGIPLSEEWLIKFGFIKSTQREPLLTAWDEFTLGNVVIWNKGVGLKEYFFGAGRIMVRVEYVHQLMNLNFALTGQELTVKEFAHD